MHQRSEGCTGTPQETLRDRVTFKRKTHVFQKRLYGNRGSWTNGFGQFDHISLLGKLRSKTVELGRNAAKCDGKQIRGNRVIFKSKLSRHVRDGNKVGRSSGSEPGAVTLTANATRGSGCSERCAEPAGQPRCCPRAPRATTSARPRAPATSLSPPNHRRGPSLPGSRTPGAAACTYPVRRAAGGSAEADPSSPAGVPIRRPHPREGSWRRAGHRAMQPGVEPARSGRHSTSRWAPAGETRAEAGGLGLSPEHHLCNELSTSPSSCVVKGSS